MAFAKTTDVPVEKTKTEIERLLRRYGATGFMNAWIGDRASVAFEMVGRRIRFDLVMPPEKDFAYTAGGRTRSKADRQTAYDQAIRSRWRALLLVVKAKLEAVDAGIVTLEAEFLSNIILPTGETVGERTIPQIADAYAGRSMPPLLPPPSR